MKTSTSNLDITEVTPPEAPNPAEVPVHNIHNNDVGINPTSTAAAKGRGRGFRPLILIILVLLAGGIGLSYICYHQQQQFAEQARALRNQLAQLNTITDRLQKDQQSLQGALEQANKGGNSYQYTGTLLAANQLATAANIALKTENNINQAQALLTEALLLLTDTPGYSTVKQALESALVKLKSFTPLHQEEVVTQLIQLHQQVNSLEQTFAFTPRVNKYADQNTASGSTNGGNNNTALATTTTSSPSFMASIKTLWHQTMLSMANTLRGVVTISHKEKLPLVLTTTQLNNLKINIQTLLLEATWAAEHRQAKIYKMALQEASTIFQTYFYADDKTKNDILPQLQKLQQIDIELKAMNIDEILKAIAYALQQNSSAK
jgi:uncharacterized protein HemX